MVRRIPSLRALALALLFLLLGERLGGRARDPPRLVQRAQAAEPALCRRRRVLGIAVSFALVLIRQDLLALGRSSIARQLLLRRWSWGLRRRGRRRRGRRGRLLRLRRRRRGRRRRRRRSSARRC